MQRFDHPLRQYDWVGQVTAYSRAGVLAGFVNVAWDGGAHAFILDTVVSERVRRPGVGARLVAVAADHARAAGIAWLMSTSRAVFGTSTSARVVSPRPTPG